MLDATVLFAGTVWPRWSYEVLQHARKGDYRLLLSERVIGSARKWLAIRFPDFANLFDETVLPTLEYEPVAEPSAEAVAQNLHLVRQLSDVPVALAAIDASVDYFVTEDKDFTQRHPSTALLQSKLNIMRPVIFLREVMGRTSEELEQIRKRSWTDLS
jgi:predicted nucleic acid-binding protein